MCTCREYKEPYRPASPAGAARRRTLLNASHARRPVPEQRQEPVETPRGAASLAPPARPR